MKYQASTRNLVLAAATILLGMSSVGPLSAAPSISVHIGAQAPPPLREERQWESPYHTAVWIPGRYEWSNESYVWIGGYYDYPPHENSHWVSPRYSHHEAGNSYRSGHWSN